MVDDLTHRFYDVGNEDERIYWTIMATGVRAMCVNRPDVLKQMLAGQALNSRTLMWMTQYVYYLASDNCRNKPHSVPGDTML